jgi:hypothetical protein
VKALWDLAAGLARMSMQLRGQRVIVQGGSLCGGKNIAEK